MAVRYLTTPINDWPVQRLLSLSAILLAIMAVLIGLASAGFDIPVLRQVTGFIFLTFIPGVLILRILRVHGISATESLVYSAGLSIAFVMFSGALTNLLLPAAGIQQPLSLLPVTITIAFLIIILMAVAWIRDRGFIPPEVTSPVIKIPLVPVFSLVLLFALTVLGVTLVDCYQNNLLLLICLIAIVAVVGLAAFGKFIQPALYPLAIFTIGLCLLYQTTLMSPYLVGQDIYTEYHFYRQVADSGFWNFAFPSTVNSCLSITIMAPVYSLFLGIDGRWVFKAIYPLIFALVPVILFQVFRRQTSPKKAFLSAFFFVAVPTFSLEMISLCRQQVAELFFALVILLLIERKLKAGTKLALLTIFTVSIIVSHYALGFIGFIYMGLLLPLVLIIRSSAFQKIWSWIIIKSGGLPPVMKKPRALPAKALAILVAVYFISALAWYGTVASGLNAAVVGGIWTGHTTTITTEVGKIVSKPAGPAVSTDLPAFLQFSKRDTLVQTALGLDFPRSSPEGKAFRILQYATQLLLVLGCLRLFFRPGQMRFTIEYIALSVASALLLLACIFLPLFADQLNTTRIYHIALMTLAPFCILGGEAVWLGAVSLWHRIKYVVPGTSMRAATNQFNNAGAEDSPGGLKFVALAVLIPYFLFTSGFIYEITGQEVTDKIETPYSIALSSYRLNLAGVFYLKDGAAAKWLAQKADVKSETYGDYHTANILGFYEFPGQLLYFSQPADLVQGGEYIYFTAWNMDKRAVIVGFATGLRRQIKWDDVPGLTQDIINSNRIYYNMGAQILYIH